MFDLLVQSYAQRRKVAKRDFPQVDLQYQVFVGAEYIPEQCGLAHVKHVKADRKPYTILLVYLPNQVSPKDCGERRGS
jgi:hypothetical protein